MNLRQQKMRAAEMEKIQSRTEMPMDEKIPKFTISIEGDGISLTKSGVEKYRVPHVIAQFTESVVTTGIVEFTLHVEKEVD